jgi:hypothetical protein
LNAEITVELTGNARNEGGRHEDGGQDQRDRNDGRSHLVHRHMRRLTRRHAARKIALDVLDDDDRIVDDDADRQHQAEERQHVQRKAEGEEHCEGSDQRDGNGDDRNDCRAPGLEKDDDHQRD